jgi:uncharacterized protein with GYD domain
MATYVSLVNFTEQGVRDIKATAERAEKFKATAQKAGVTVIILPKNWAHD